VGEEALAGKSTLNRLELSTETPSRYKKIHCRQEAIDALWTAVFLEAHSAPPERIVLDLDTTGLRLAGHQEGRFFHAYYDEYCYLPLYIFSGEHLLCARLRTADQDAAAGSKEEVERIVGQIRQAWPEVEIILRADSGFCRDELMKWSEEQGVGYVFGFARNDRLRRLIAPQMEEAARLQKESGKPARVFSEFDYQTTTGSWNRARRVVAKAEHLEKGANPRFVGIRPADPSPRAGQPNTESSSPARITGSRLDLSPFLRQTVKAQNSANGMKMPFKGGLSYGFVSTAVHQGVQAGACGR
jgi:hypothetical protein